jgi:two-component system chemotaxis response regulator CheB
MNARDVIVIGTSADRIAALSLLVSTLPADLPASIFVVRHSAPELPSILPRLIERAGRLTASHALDGELIRKSHVYVAPPDHHMLLDDGNISLSKGPKENRMRPAVDPLFRSAALTFRERVVGVILSGTLDDGTAGLWSVKHRGGVTIVQDPLDAKYPSMPQSALNNVKVDHCVPLADIGPLLIEFANDDVETPDDQGCDVCNRLEAENRIALGDWTSVRAVQHLGKLTRFNCPDCHASMWQLDSDNFIRFRCSTGHAFTGDALLATQNDTIENVLHDALRAIEENDVLTAYLREQAERMGRQLPVEPQPGTIYTDYRAGLIEQALLNHEAHKPRLMPVFASATERPFRIMSTVAPRTHPESSKTDRR